MNLKHRTKQAALVWGSFILVFSLAFFGCPMPSGPADDTPAGTDTGVISGRIVFAGGSTRAGIAVSLEKTDGLLSASVRSAARSIAETGDVDAASDEVLAAARGAAPSIMAQTTTDKDGYYRFTNLASGTYTIYASAPDSAEKAAVIHVALRAGESISADELQLTPVGSIAGRIRLDNSETGNAGFLVCVAGTSYMAVTGGDGNFVITGVPAGEGYRIIIIKGNYIDFWSESSVSVTAGETSVLTPNPKELTGEMLNGSEGGTFLVTFNADGGSPAPESPIFVPQRAKLSAPEAMTKNGYTFEGWYTDSGLTAPANFPLTINADITLYAKWEEMPGFTFYNVRFASHGGSQIADQRVAENSIATRPLDPIKSGWKFSGWYSDIEMNNAYDFNTPVIKNTVLYGKWNFIALPIIEIEDIEVYLAGQEREASLDDLVYLSISMRLTESNWIAILGALTEAGKSVALDLSDCSRSLINSGIGLRSDGVFDSTSLGNDNVVSLILPDAADRIAGVDGTTQAFSGFRYLQSASGKVSIIGTYAFRGCKALKNLSFPVATRIQSSAFRDCRGLTSVSFPEVIDIYPNAFKECDALTIVSFPKATSIGNNAFNGCKSLTSVSFPKVTDIDVNAFSGCTRLNKVSIGENCSIQESDSSFEYFRTYYNGSSGHAPQAAGVYTWTGVSPDYWIWEGPLP